MVKRECYLKIDTKEYFMSCGFFKWASIVLPLELEQIDGVSYLMPCSKLDSVKWCVTNTIEEVLHVPTEVRPPCALPLKLARRCCCAIAVTGEHQQVLRPAFSGLY